MREKEKKQMKKSKNLSKIVATCSLIMIFAFMFIASGFNNAWGKVDISDIYYPNSEGGMIHAQLFVPKGVSSTDPVPAILNMHGGSDYLQTVSNYSIELARRGYVVLSVDAYGSGSSDFISGAVASNAGGADAGKASALVMDGGASLGIEQLLSYKFVDSNRIGLAGHSMGGTYIANAALMFPDNVKAIMPWGSGSFVDKMKTTDPAEFKFNVGYINATSDEMGYFAVHDYTTTLLNSQELETFFGTNEAIEPGKVYGSFENGTGRVIYTPNTTHIGNIICKDSIGAMAEYFTEAMPSGVVLSENNQVWMYKELFCVLATIALVIFMVSLGYLLLDTKYFSNLKVSSSKNIVSWNKGIEIVGIVLCILVPALTLHKIGLWIATKPANAFLPFNWANNLTWIALINSLIILVFLVVVYFAYGKKKGISLATCGFGDQDGLISVKKVFKALLLAVILMTATYFIVNLCYLR